MRRATHRRSACNVLSRKVESEPLREGEDEPVFVVENRLFIWKSPEHLVLQVLLGLPPTESEADPPAP